MLPYPAAGKRLIANSEFLVAPDRVLTSLLRKALLEVLAQRGPAMAKSIASRAVTRASRQLITIRTIGPLVGDAVEVGFRQVFRAHGYPHLTLRIEVQKERLTQSGNLLRIGDVDDDGWPGHAATDHHG